MVIHVRDDPGVGKTSGMVVILFYIIIIIISSSSSSYFQGKQRLFCSVHFICISSQFREVAVFDIVDLKIKFYVLCDE
jgi:hypothetical protein